MNANADNHAEPTAETADIIILKYDKKHEENKTFKHIQKPKKAKNLTQYLSKYLDKINDLTQYFIKIDDVEEDEEGEEIFKYDREFRTEKEINEAIINLIIDMFYNVNYEDDKKILRKKFIYLVENKIKHPYFLIEDITETATFYPINYIFQYIKKTIKGKDDEKLFNKIKSCKFEFIPKVKAEPLSQNFDCGICADNIQLNHIINYNCECINLICEGCYRGLINPKKCPFCRKTPYKLNLTIPQDEPAKRKMTIKYNNKTYEKTYKFDYIKNSSLFYFNIDNETFNDFIFKIKSDYELKEDFVMDDDKFSNFILYTVNTNYLFSNQNRTHTDKISEFNLDILKNYYYNETDEIHNEFIENILGLYSGDEKINFLDEFFYSNDIYDLYEDDNNKIYHEYEDDGKQNYIIITEPTEEMNNFFKVET